MAAGSPSLMWSKEDDTKYQEAETQRKILYTPTLSYFLSALLLQCLRLPNELKNPDISGPSSGQTTADIEASIVRGVKMLRAMTRPLRQMLKFKDAATTEKWKDEYVAPVDYDTAMTALETILQMLDDLGMLNSLIITQDLPDIDEFYDRDAVIDDDSTPEKEATIAKVPTPLPSADDAPVGKMEGQNPRPVA